MADFDPSGFTALGDALLGQGALSQARGMQMGLQLQNLAAQGGYLSAQTRKALADASEAQANALKGEDTNTARAQLGDFFRQLGIPNPDAEAGIYRASGGSFDQVQQGLYRATAPIEVPNTYALRPGVPQPQIFQTPAGQAATNEQNARAGYYEAFAGRGGARLPAGYQPDPDNPGHLMPIPGGPADKSSATQQALGDPNATGDAYLASIPDAGLRQLVKAIAEGREQVPRIYRSGAAGQIGPTQIAAAVSRYDPSFNAQDYNSRNRMRINATSGPMAQNMLRLNQAAAHLGQLATQVGGTSGVALPLVGGLINRAANAAEDPYTGDITRYQTTADAVAHEVRALFAGSSGGTLQELEGYLKDLSPSNSTAQKRAAIGNIAQLIHSRIGLLQDQYSQGMQGAADPFSIVFPHAKGTLDALIAMEGGQVPAAATAAASPSGVPARPVVTAPASARTPAPSVPLTNAQGWRLMVDPQGNRAYVSPDGKQFQELR